MLDGCHHVYLDMGSNTGVQIRKLYEPHNFPNSSVFKIFDKYFGDERQRYLDKICTVGFEPNMMHKSRLEDLQRSYKNCGWNVVIMVGVGVGAEEKDVRFVHRKKFKLNNGHGTMEKPPVTFFMDQIGHAGTTMEGDYAQDSEDETLVSTVRQIRIADFINNVVAQRRLPAPSSQENGLGPPSLVMKLDVEGREPEVVLDLVMSGALAHIDNIHIDWSGNVCPGKCGNSSYYTNQNEVEQLARAMDTLTFLGKKWTSGHVTEVSREDDEMYSHFDGPLPQCNIKNRIVV